MHPTHYHLGKALLIGLITAAGVAPAPKVVFFFGDSLTAGYGLSKDEAFPAQIERLLTERGKRVRAVNGGLSGETSAGGQSRIGWALRQPLDVFVLELGANDALRGLSIEQTRRNLQAIVDTVKVKRPKARIVIAGMQAPPNMGKEYAVAFKSIYPQLARHNGAALIPFLLEGVAGDPSLNLADGIHPNAKGHQIIARQGAKIIEPLLP